MTQTVDSSPARQRDLVVARAVGDLRARVQAWKQQDLRVGLVPTMGALHEGHLALVRAAAERADRVVTSIFVNPTQFGPDEDLDRYPRNEEEDVSQLAANRCDLVFLPEVDTIYPPGGVTFVDLDESAGAPSRGFEGTFRPGHFRGVATVVAKLFNLVAPDIAVFGQKDAQQLAVIQRMVGDLHFDLEIVAHPTVREPDGLAMSSRNAYLTPEQRRAAPAIQQALLAARAAIEQGQHDADSIRKLLRDRLEAEPLFETNYADVVDADSFQPIDTITGEAILPVAVDVGGTRLLDNVRVQRKPTLRP